MIPFTQSVHIMVLPSFVARNAVCGVAIVESGVVISNANVVMGSNYNLSFQKHCLV